jgi:ribosomal protein S18 acetylase RimI-like enzyme
MSQPAQSAQPPAADRLTPLIPDESAALEPMPINIRPFRPGDAEQVRWLYDEGRLGGAAADNDTGLDIDDIEHAYPADGRSGFWIAESRDCADHDGIVGMIGVQQHEPGVAEIRRLRVRPELRRRGVGSKLLELAVRHCVDSGCVKVTLDTHIDRGPAIKLFEKFRFRHGTTRTTSGNDMMLFYLDLYGSEEGI